MIDRTELANQLRETAVPSGWQLVPVEPTAEMVAAYLAAAEAMEALGMNGTLRFIDPPYPLYLRALPAQATEERKAWEPYLSDRADGVRGHYAICRWNPAGYQEAWNLRSHRWASTSDEVLTLETATDLLKRLVIPTAPQPALKLPEPMTDKEIYDNDEIMGANCFAGLMFEDFALVVRTIEAAVMRRVREANK